MDDTPRQTPVTPPSSTASILNVNQVDELNDVISQAVGDAIFHLDLDKYDLPTNKLIIKHNRRFFPIMLDELFVAKIIDFRGSCNTEEEVELEVQHLMDQENTCKYKAFEDAKLKDGFDLICLPPDKDKQHRLMNSTRTESVHGYQDYVAICTPILVEMSRKLRDMSGGRPKRGSKVGPKGVSKARSKGKTGSKMSVEVSKTEGTRSSARIKAKSK